MPLRDSIATPDGKRRYVRVLFATIAHRYDFITVALSYGQDRRWKRQPIALPGVTSDDRVLDVACATGDLLFATPPRAQQPAALDVTFGILQPPRAKARPAPS